MNLAVPKKAHEETFLTLVTRKNYDQCIGEKKNIYLLHNIFLDIEYEAFSSGQILICVII